MENPAAVPEKFKVGGLEVQGKIGQGGMGMVFKAFQPSLGRAVALKVLPREMSTSKTFVDRFLREARAAAQVDHPNIVKIHDVGEDKGVYYIIMEFVDGQTIGQALRERGPLPEAEALRIIRAVAEALDAVHGKGIVHRDVKPGNIMLDHRGHVKLMDFGIAKPIENVQVGGDNLTIQGSFVGSIKHASPEQFEGRILDRRSDIYSLGVVFYELLAGVVPFEGETINTIGIKHVGEPPPPLLQRRPSLDPRVEGIAMKCLEKKAERRFQSCAELVRRIDEVLGGPPAASLFGVEPATMTVGAMAAVGDDDPTKVYKE